ncbi:MAG: imidazole glycerol phosphate synthase subunit HisH [Campylobacteraceae bacterium]|jgi:glutamine amidotransferase|nr:imidazole glycerol phosphate synthase subunit HisH [Campylobacteraceae bacterium]
MTALIDYNTGNLQSVINAIEKIGQKAVLVKNPEELKGYDRAILPGVGAFGDAMQFLKQSGMDKAIIEFAKSGKALLGICLGMQLLFDKSSEFGSNDGLGLIEGVVTAFDKTKFKTPLKVPHMGWNSFSIKQDSPLLRDLKDGTYLYFVHSFHVVCDKKYIIASTNYGYDFPSIVQKDSIYGFQPHPEKSHENGLKILKNFMEI